MAKKDVPELVIEFFTERANYIYLTLIEYKKKNHLCIIDNVNKNEISAYVLDFAKAEGIDVDELLSISTRWYYEASEKYPLSFEFAKRGLSEQMAPIRKSFKKDYISRFVGHPFSYNIDKKPKVRRKRVTKIPKTVEIKFKAPD